MGEIEIIDLTDPTVEAIVKENIIQNDYEELIEKINIKETTLTTTAQDLIDNIKKAQLSVVKVLKNNSIKVADTPELDSHIDSDIIFIINTARSFVNTT